MVRVSGFGQTGPELGEHNAEVYAELLNITAAELVQLEQAGTI